MKKVSLKLNIAIFLAIVFCCLNNQSFAEEFEIDLPPVKEQTDKIKEQTKTKLQKIKKNIDDKILKATGKPTTKSLTGLSKKEIR